jgi:hypothetical protein
LVIRDWKTGRSKSSKTSERKKCFNEFNQLKTRKSNPVKFGKIAKQD